MGFRRTQWRIVSRSRARARSHSPLMACKVIFPGKESRGVRQSHSDFNRLPKQWQFIP